MSNDFTGATDPSAPQRPARPPKTSGKAIASLVLGLLSFVTWLLSGVPAVVFGAGALSDIKKSKGRLKGGGLATAGIVLGIVGSLVASAMLLLPAMWAAKTAAARNQSTNKMKMIGLAVLNYHDVFRQLPPAHSESDDGEPLLSWRVAVLPYMEEATLAQKFNKREAWDSATNRPLLKPCPELYLSPADTGNDGTQTNVLAIVGPDTLITTGEKVSMRDIRDGAHKTIVAVELAGAGIPWSAPRDITVDQFVAAVRRPLGAADLHPVYKGGVVCLMADASVRFLPADTDEATLRGLCTRSGGEPITLDDY